MASSVDRTLSRLVNRRLNAATKEMARAQRLVDLRNGITKVTAVVEYHGAGLRLFRLSERNALVRAGFQHIGDFWLSDYLPLRFQRGYAIRVLGYAGKKRFWPGATPLVDSGDLRESVLTRGYAVARATSSRAAVTIRLPTPAKGDFRYSSNPIVNNPLRLLPPTELRALTNRLKRWMGEAIHDSVLLTKPARGKKPARQIRRINLLQRRLFREASVRHTIRRDQHERQAS